MAGIYIHIPFCKSKCNYCDFYSITNTERKQECISALKTEIISRKDYLNGDTVETIYFGGGTPSLLDTMEVYTILKTITNNFHVSEHAEITFEINPNDVDLYYLKNILHSGINRLSIGVQSFHDDDLMFLGRRHNAQESVSAILNAQNAGFDNISIDFIFGHVMSDEQKISKNIETAIKLNIPHISAYHITYEKGTPLYSMIQNKKTTIPNEETGISQFSLIMKSLKEHGFIHYEISNYCREGYESKHNSSYWSGEKYLGVGSSAHSFNGTSRRWNVSNIDEYISGINDSVPYFSSEELTEKNLFNEYVMTRLRTNKGIDAAEFRKMFPGISLKNFFETINSYLSSGKILLYNNNISLTDEGKLIADKIISDLFVV